MCLASPFWCTPCATIAQPRRLLSEVGVCPSQHHTAPLLTAAAAAAPVAVMLCHVVHPHPHTVSIYIM